jgi:hypothetical protein
LQLLSHNVQQCAPFALNAFQRPLCRMRMLQRSQVASHRHDGVSANVAHDLLTALATKAKLVACFYAAGFNEPLLSKDGVVFLTKTQSGQAWVSLTQRIVNHVGACGDAHVFYFKA